jgi:hypothetical protein
MISKTLVPCCGLQGRIENCHGTESKKQQGTSWSHSRRSMKVALAYAYLWRVPVHKKEDNNNIISVPDLFCS